MGPQRLTSRRNTLQVVDDILDITQTTEQLGKTAGKDLATSKTTYPSILGLDQVPWMTLVYCRSCIPRCSA